MQHLLEHEKHQNYLMNTPLILYDTSVHFIS